MWKSKQILVSLLGLAAVLFNLAGCGQTGNLYLPDKTAGQNAK
ncbi:MAG: lipoprotein [Rhodoferax sp.]|nr:lipoprotein [Rhodoferax sp.]